MKTGVIITAIGVVNALGRSVVEVTSRLFSGDQSGLRQSSAFLPDRGCFVGLVQGELPHPPPELEVLWSRNAALSLVAVEQIRNRVHDVVERYGPRRVGVVLGSSTSGIAQGEAAVSFRKEHGVLPPGYSYAQQEMGTVSTVVSRLLGVSGPSYTVSTACSSSAKVFRAGVDLIQTGMCDAVVVGGIDSLCRLTVNGFASLELVSETVTNPFSKNRNGITIGEGGALFVLERTGAPLEGAPVISVLGVGESSDAYHISSPDVEGRGAITAMRAALNEGGITPDQLDYLNLHGTGTLHNDAMEALAVNTVFPDGVACSSTKPMVGHMLGASGATEIAFCWMVLTDSMDRLPPHLFDGQYDAALPVLQLVPPNARVSTPARYALSSSFGFGGSNCAVLLGRDFYV